jgi:hypothetical protein
MRSVLFTVVALLLAAGPAPAQMPDAREMSGVPLPSGDLASGEVSVRLIRGQLSNNIADHPVELHEAGGPVRTTRTDEDGRARFSNVPLGASVQAVAVVDGERLESQTFPVPSQGGIRLMLVASSPGAPMPAPVAPGTAGDVSALAIGGQSRFVIEVIDEAIQVYHLFEIVNRQGSALMLAEPVVFDLPAGVRSATILQGSSPQATAEGPQVLVRGPFQPGSTLVQFAYRMPYDRGTLAIDQPVPIALEQLMVVVEQEGGIGIESPQLANTREVTAEGQRYILANGPGVSAGDRVQLTLSGLPYHSRLPTYIALGLAVAILGVGGWAAFIGGRRISGGDARRRLEARRESLFGELVRLDELSVRDEVDASHYRKRRADLVAELESVYALLDQADEAQSSAVRPDAPAPAGPEGRRAAGSS